MQYDQDWLLKNLSLHSSKTLRHGHLTIEYASKLEASPLSLFEEK